MRVVRVFCLIFVSLFLVVYAYAGDQKFMYTADSNDDGKPDQWYNMQNNMVTYIEMDRNYDGEVDYKAEYNDEGKMETEEMDFNFDGKMDDFYYYDEEGILAREEIDSNFDGKVDVWIYLYKGIYIKKYEKDTNFDGKIDVVKDYDKGKE